MLRYRCSLVSRTHTAICGTERIALSESSNQMRRTDSLWQSHRLPLGITARLPRCSMWETGCQAMPEIGSTRRRSILTDLPECRHRRVQHPLHITVMVLMVIPPLPVPVPLSGLALLAMVASLAWRASVVTLPPRLPMRPCRRPSAKSMAILTRFRRSMLPDSVMRLRGTAGKPSNPAQAS